MKKIAGCIVIYYPDKKRLEQVLRSVTPQVDELYIYNNGVLEFDNFREKIIQQFKIPITFLGDGENKGIAYALNKCCEEATNKYEWILILDQDTVCPNSMIKTYEPYLEDPNVAIVCPSIIDTEIANNKWATSTDKEVESVQMCIQSGALYNLNAWKQVGGFDAWMFIDFVDFDYCKKVEINQYTILRCNQVVVNQEFGKREKTLGASLYLKIFNKTHIKLFKYLSYRNVFSDARIYYTVRNNIAYIRRYRKYINVKVERKRLFVRIIKRILRSKNKLKVAKAVYKGIAEMKDKEVEEYIPTRKF